jgi:hypothetical protein
MKSRSRSRYRKQHSRLRWATIRRSAVRLGWPPGPDRSLRNVARIMIRANTRVGKGADTEWLSPPEQCSAVPTRRWRAANIFDVRDWPIGSYVDKIIVMSQHTSVSIMPSRKACSAIPLFTIAGIFVFNLFGFIVTLPGTISSFESVNRHLCWMYHNIFVYITYHAVGLLLNSISIYAMWRLSSAGRCGLYALIFTLTLGLLLLEAISTVHSCWH